MTTRKNKKHPRGKRPFSGRRRGKGSSEQFMHRPDGGRISHNRVFFYEKNGTQIYTDQDGQKRIKEDLRQSALIPVSPRPIRFA
jgi:hypothetical protein